MCHISIEGDLAQAYDDPKMFQLLDLGTQVAGAVTNLLRGGLIAGGRTTNDRSNPCLAQFEAVVSRGTLGLIREAGLMQHGIHKISGAVPGKGPASPVGSMGSGS